MKHWITSTALLFGLTLTASAQTTIELEVYSFRPRTQADDSQTGFRRGVEGYWRSIPLNDEGRGQMRRLVTSRFPEGQGARSHTYRIFQRLQDPTVRDAMIAAASIPGEARIQVRVNPMDRRRSLLAGEEIQVPHLAAGRDPATNRLPDTTYRVRRGDTFAGIATRLLRDQATRSPQLRTILRDRAQRRDYVARVVESIIERNGTRFYSWPEATHEHGGDVIYFGEYAFREGGGLRPTEAIDETLVHEAGHLGDTSVCADWGDAYGPDGNHSGDEVITPNAAFAEGWANYQAIQVSRHQRNQVGNGLRTQSLYHETSDSRIAPENHRIEEMVSNEFFVARLLKVCETATSVEAMNQAFLATFQQDCPTAPDFLAALGRWAPDADLERILAVAFFNRDRSRYARLIQGSLPDGMRPDRIPAPGMNFELDEVTATAPAEAAATQDGPYGI